MRISASDPIAYQIGVSSDADLLIRKYWNDSTFDLQEQFKIILLNRANKFLGIVDISTGGIAGTVADPKLMFGSTESSRHWNDPCSQLPERQRMPSQADIDLTWKMKEGGKLPDIGVLDHLILTREKYYSFADEGLM